VPLYGTIEVINVMMNKKNGDNEKMSKNECMVISREDWLNLKERSYGIPSYKVRYLKNMEKREKSNYFN